MRPIAKFCYAAFLVLGLAIAPLTAKGEPGDLFASIDSVPGNSLGSICRYTPLGVRSTVASGLPRPRGLAFDSAGNLFVATNSGDDPALCHPRILKITREGAQHAFATIQDSFFAQGLAIDRSDNLYVMAIGHSDSGSTIFKLTPAGEQTSFGVIPGHGLGLAFDSAGNLFAADATGQTIYRFSPDGTRSVFVGPESFSKTEMDPMCLAFDRLGNLYVSTVLFPYNNDRILKFAPNGDKRTFASGLPSPRGVIVDGANRLFVANTSASAGGDILKFTRHGAATVFASDVAVSQENAAPHYLIIQPPKP